MTPTAPVPDPFDPPNVDVVVLGGGAAGLSGALTLARARRSVLVLDEGHPRNAPAAGVHGFLTRDGMAPADLVATGAAEVSAYGGEVRAATVTAARRDDAGFVVDTADGATVRARRLLVTTGLVDELPDIPGLRERWGHEVVHCPYCHGWEIRDTPIAVIGTNAWAAHQALLFRQWSDDVVLVRHGGPAPTAEEAEQLAARGIPVVDGPVERLEIVDDRVAGVRLASGEVLARTTLTVSPRFVARTEVLAGIGLVPSEHPMGVGTRIEADATGRTAVDGVWVAGNVADPVAQVISSSAAGVMAGAMINMDLITEETRTAVAHHRAHAVAVDERFTAEFWDARYGDAERLWSGNPNQRLVEEVADLAPGHALEVGAGEGADAMWLAGRGWRVTATDVSGVALDRAAAHAAGRPGAEVITWRRLDLTAPGTAPEPAAYDLVVAHYVQFPSALRRRIYADLARAVAPGGTLLLVGHDISDLSTTMPRPPEPDLFFTADELAAELDGEWIVATAAAKPREAADPEGRRVTVHDAVLRARRGGPAAEVAVAAPGRAGTPVG